MIDKEELASNMIRAAVDILGERWPDVADYAEAEFRKLAQMIIDIERLKMSDRIDATEARALVEIHKNTTKTVLLCVEGLTLLNVEQAVNAAMDSGRRQVNESLAFRLL